MSGKLAFYRVASGLAAAGALLAVSVLAFSASPHKDKPEKPEKTSRQEKRRQKEIQKEQESAYRKWIQEEVPYIITDEERAAFKKLSTDDEREQFIEAFWNRRNPNPSSPENEFKE